MIVQHPIDADSSALNEECEKCEGSGDGECSVCSGKGECICNCPNCSGDCRECDGNECCAECEVNDEY